MRKKIVLAMIVLLYLPSTWAGAEDRPTIRARPPKWTAQVVEAFFQDAREQLKGERPGPTVAVIPGATSADVAAEVPGNFKWSALIEADALTTEVKRIKNRLTPLLARTGSFKSGGCVEARREFSLLAVLFTIVDQYDQEVRWQQEAARMRGLCARAAQACEKPSDESFALGVDVHSQLAELLRGQSTTSQAAGDEPLVDRGQLMLRMELALEENISPWLANQKEFRRRKSDVAQESQLLAMLARIVCREPYDYADDEGFVDLAREMGRAAQQLSEASAKNDYEAARKAAGRVTQSCSECHDGYRG
jgi:hypothetical protein